MRQTFEAFAVVRKDAATNEEFVDLSTVSYTRDGCVLKARETSPGWKETNPQQRVARFRWEELR